MQHRATDLLRDILDAAAYIHEDTAGISLDDFAQDRRTRQLVERNFGIIGEAINRLYRIDSSIVSQISDYEQIIAFRNILIHGYDNIDYRRVWDLIQTHLPVLRTEVIALLNDTEQ